jgi:hypothetical protein
MTAAFSWQKELVRRAEAESGGSVPVNDAYNRGNQKYLSANSQPFVLVTGFNCEVAAPGKNRWAKAALRGWTLGGILRYSSGMPILIPTANNALNSLLFRNTSSATFANRVPGQPLFLKDLNCHCFRSEHDFCAEP